MRWSLVCAFILIFKNFFCLYILFVNTTGYSYTRNNLFVCLIAFIVSFFRNVVNLVMLGLIRSHLTKIAVSSIFRGPRVQVNIQVWMLKCTQEFIHKYVLIYVFNVSVWLFVFYIKQNISYALFRCRIEKGKTLFITFALT